MFISTLPMRNLKQGWCSHFPKAPGLEFERRTFTVNQRFSRWEHLAKTGDCHNSGWGCSWHPMGGAGCCEHLAVPPPQAKNHQAPNVIARSSREVLSPCRQAWPPPQCTLPGGLARARGVQLLVMICSFCAPHPHIRRSRLCSPLCTPGKVSAQ